MIINRVALTTTATIIFTDRTVTAQFAADIHDRIAAAISSADVTSGRIGQTDAMTVELTLTKDASIPLEQYVAAMRKVRTLTEEAVATIAGAATWTWSQTTSRALRPITV
jgi:hypothetical protein